MNCHNYKLNCEKNYNMNYESHNMYCKDYNMNCENYSMKCENPFSVRVPLPTEGFGEREKTREERETKYYLTPPPASLPPFLPSPSSLAPTRFFSCPCATKHALAPSTCSYRASCSFQVTKARLNDQKQWPANSMGLTKEVLESYLTRAESIAPIIPGTLVYLRPRRDGTWGDGLDKGIVKPRRGVVSSHQGGGSSGEFGSRGSVSRVTPSRLRWGLVSEHSPPLPRQHEGGLAGSLAAATAAGVATGVAPGLLSTSQLGYASLTVAAAAAAASSKRGGSCCGGRGGIGDVEVCIVNPRGKEVPPLLVEKWRVVRRDFEDDALKALADTQGKKVDDWLILPLAFY